MEDNVKKLIDDMGINTFINEGEIPNWIIELAEKIVWSGWKKID
jgi:hypothetical protein